ncbi:MAG: 5-methylthioadenosine/adenosylhomocysteine nucleosidase [Burkholderiales bacterium]|jgi:adenosylhomocysteine nucleosidase|nr:5-methylthioadenosine/adenosylhomocysteine nucleosidase [Burkholderiales bacterium]
MKIAIICAMQEELESIITSLGGECTVKQYGVFEVYTAKYNAHELVFILCGIGKVNAALHTQFIIDKFTPDYVINVGVAGGLTSELDFGDVVIAHDLLHHDMDVTAFGIPLGQIPRMDIFAFKSNDNLLDLAKGIATSDFKVHIGRIVSGDQFIEDIARASVIQTTFSALACEMEGAAVAHVCHVNQVPFLVVRALSDKAGTDDKSAVHSFDELKHMVAHRSSFIVQQILLKI